MKIKTRGSQAFNVPNTDEGREFCRLLRKFINRKGWGFRRRGRGPRQGFGANQHGIPLDNPFCKWMAVYLSDRKRGPRPLTREQINEFWNTPVERMHHILPDALQRDGFHGKPGQVPAVAKVEPPPDETELNQEELNFLGTLLNVAADHDTVYNLAHLLGTSSADVNKLRKELYNKLID